MRSKMIPPIPSTNESDHDRFKRFAKAILAVPKSEIERTVAESMKQKVTPTLKPEKAIRPHHGPDIEE